MIAFFIKYRLQIVHAFLCFFWFFWVTGEPFDHGQFLLSVYQFIIVVVFVFLPFWNIGKALLSATAILCADFALLLLFHSTEYPESIYRFFRAIEIATDFERRFHRELVRYDHHIGTSDTPYFLVIFLCYLTSLVTIVLIHRKRVSFRRENR